MSLYLSILYANCSIEAPGPSVLSLCISKYGILIHTLHWFTRIFVFSNCFLLCSPVLFWNLRVPTLTVCNLAFVGLEFTHRASVQAYMLFRTSLKAYSPYIDPIVTLHSHSAPLFVHSSHGAPHSAHKCNDALHIHSLTLLLFLTLQTALFWLLIVQTALLMLPKN